MTGYFYFDRYAQKRGPFGVQELKELAENGEIDSQTLVLAGDIIFEAGKLSGLNTKGEASNICITELTVEKN
jgi:hypothetical protein